MSFDDPVILKRVKEMEKGDLNRETKKMSYLSDTCKSGLKTSVLSWFSMLFFPLY